MNLSRINVFVATALLWSLLCSETAEAQSKQSDKPNIVLINMDDMGLGDVEPYGGTSYTTPHINKLAAQGMRFTNFYAASSICSPSRAALMTGAYPNRVGIPFVLFPEADRGLSQDEETIAGLLQKVGYSTGIIGKWHLGDSKKFLPLQHGFDYFFGLPYSNDMWPMDFKNEPVQPSDSAWRKKSVFPRLPLIEGNTTIRHLDSMPQQNNLTTLYTEKAVDYIEEHKNSPFFLYLAHQMVHVPLAVSNKFRGKSDQGLFGDVMMEIDWSLGQVMKALKENGLEDNTLVIFTADNGPWRLFGNHGGSTAGLRGEKTNTWEGGQREPSIMRWPGVIPAGTVNNKLASNMDILPTLAEITDAPKPENKIDGVNILPLLKANEEAHPRNHLFFYYINKLGGVRQGKWKLVVPHSYLTADHQGHDGFPGEIGKDSTGLALYNLRNDKGERYDVKEDHPEVMKRMKKLIEKARKDLGDANTDREGENRREPGWKKEE